MAATPLAPPASAALPRKKWTLEECDQIASVADLARYELLDGELIEKVSKNLPHMRASVVLIDWLRQILAVIS